jgi:hypothetical protein
MAYKGTLAGGTTVRSEDSAVSKCTVYDVSHMGVSCSSELSLVALPQLYTELYARVKGPYTCLAVPDYDPAVCLGKRYNTRLSSLKVFACTHGVRQTVYLPLELVVISLQHVSAMCSCSGY